MHRVAFLTWLHRWTGRLGLPLAAALLLATWSSAPVAVPSHRAVAASSGQDGGDTPWLDKRESGSAAVIPKSAWAWALDLKSAGAGPDAVPVALLPVPVRRPAGDRAVLPVTAALVPWHNCHRLPDHTGPPAA